MSDLIEILHPEHLPTGQVRTAIFDFDGTFSTLRCGWEKVMKKMMLEMISGGNSYDKALEEKIDAYICASTGIQTAYQMQWLKQEVDAAGQGDPNHDIWWYKDEYNRRLMEEVSHRIDRLEKGVDSPKEYLISGAIEFLKALKNAGIETFLVSGTDHKDVVREAGILGVADLFSIIKGAPERQVACSKEAVLKMLLDGNNVSGESLLLVGDGKVEISLGAQCGGYALGVASDEVLLRGINPVKRERLIKAGADVIIGDFENLPALLDWLNIQV